MAHTSTAITGLHHVGLVVRDITEARSAYARLGFVVPPTTFPALPPALGAAPQAFGAGNTHPCSTPVERRWPRPAAAATMSGITSGICGKRPLRVDLDRKGTFCGDNPVFAGLPSPV